MCQRVEEGMQADDSAVRGLLGCLPCWGGVERGGREVGWPFAVLTITAPPCSGGLSLHLFTGWISGFSRPSYSLGPHSQVQISQSCAMTTDHVVPVTSQVLRGLWSETGFSLKPGSSLCTAPSPTECLWVSFGFLPTRFLSVVINL